MLSLIEKYFHEFILNYFGYLDSDFTTALSYMQSHNFLGLINDQFYFIVFPFPFFIANLLILLNSITKFNKIYVDGDV